jgi:hypothetical protein
MRSARPWGAENWADSLPATLGFSRPPVDLYAVARHKHISHLGFRFIIPRGVLVPMTGGFQVYLRDSVRRDVDISEGEPRGFLSVRQRFSLAHEIAHTFFYKLSDSIPVPDDTVSNGFELEQVCDRTAGHILVPTSLLHREIEDYEKIDAAFIRSIASKFQTSLTVMIQRISAVASNPLERCVLLARRLNADAEIRAIYFGVGLLRTFPRPKRYTRLTEWIVDFPRPLIDRRENCDCRVIRMGRPVTFIKTELGAGNDFLLDVQIR